MSEGYKNRKQNPDKSGVPLARVPLAGTKYHHTVVAGTVTAIRVILNGGSFFPNHFLAGT